MSPLLDFPPTRRGHRQACPAANAAARALFAWILAAGTAAAQPVADPQPAQVSRDWNAHFQSTWIFQRKQALDAAYSGTNSLLPQAEKHSDTLTATAFIGLRAWSGGEVYFDPEIVSSRSLSGLTGLGGLTNGENQKGGDPKPSAYGARFFLRQTWNATDAADAVPEGPNQLAAMVAPRRLVLTVGKLSVTDLFDGNAYAHDPRTQFLNWALMTNGAYDYAANMRGYTWGAALEAYDAETAVRAGRFEQPRDADGQALDQHLFAHYGDQVEIERGYGSSGNEGRLRLLAFRNRARMGSFDDALAAWEASGHAGVPSVAGVRRVQSKTGIGVNLEQAFGESVGLFARAGRNGGAQETYAFAEIERTLGAGAVLRGASWRRPDDALGLAVVRNRLSPAHQRYLAAGGLGVFIGDGRITYQPEDIAELWYAVACGPSLTLTLDFQQIRHPAYNADRGPARVAGVRLHAQW